MMVFKKGRKLRVTEERKMKGQNVEVVETFKS
jgi:hypothetical protein